MSFLLLYILTGPQLILFGTIDRIQKSLEKKEYEKAYELIQKGQEKEPQNPGIDFYKATLFFDTEFRQYNIDTARASIRRARQKLQDASEEEQENSRDEGINIDEIERLATRIRDKEFQNTLAELSLSLIDGFKNKYPESIYEDILVYKKDSIEFENTTARNSKAAYQAFIKAHPTSVFTSQADSILDQLRVDDLLLQGDLRDFYNFLDQFPFTRRRDEIESYILKVSTVSNKPIAYLSFLQLSRVNRLRKIAADYYYFLTGKVSDMHPTADSLRSIQKLPEKWIFPTLEDDRFGFYDQAGEKTIQNRYTEIPLSTKCQLLSDSWVYVEDDAAGKILRKDGRTILSDVSGYLSISESLGLVQRGGSWFLYHKSGYRILETPLESAEIFGEKWIRIRQQGKFGLISFLGLQIAQSDYQDIYQLGPFSIFEKENLIGVYTDELIFKEVEDKGLALEFKFEEVEAVSDSMLIGFRGDRECLLDASLNFLIPWGKYEINPDPAGWYLRLPNGYKIYDSQESEVLNRVYPYIESSKDWLALKTNADWMLIPRTKGILPSRDYDSIKLVGRHAAWLKTKETQRLLFSSGKEIQVDDKSLQLTGTSGNYLLSKGPRVLTLYDSDGTSLVEGNYEEISFVNDTLLRVQVRGKQGLMSLAGDWVLNPIFDSLDEKRGLILTLSDGKIGCYDLTAKLLIPTNYESRIERVGDQYLAKNRGKYGLIDAQENITLPFDYSKIVYWNDSSYLTSTENVSRIVSLAGNPLGDPFEDATAMLSGQGHDIYRIIRDGKYGLISNQYGTLLEPAYTEIINIGTEEVPLFFADQHLDKAGFHVVSYVDHLGKLILSKAYPSEAFDRILCDD